MCNSSISAEPASKSFLNRLQSTGTRPYCVYYGVPHAVQMVGDLSSSARDIAVEFEGGVAALSGEANSLGQKVIAEEDVFHDLADAKRKIGLCLSL